MQTIRFLTKQGKLLFEGELEELTDICEVEFTDSRLYFERFESIEGESVYVLVKEIILI